VAPFTADRPCASTGFDEDNHVVLIIPSPVGNRATAPGSPAAADWAARLSAGPGPGISGRNVPWRCICDQNGWALGFRRGPARPFVAEMYRGGAFVTRTGGRSAKGSGATTTTRPWRRS
jgi:hypothetical protein